LYIHSYLPITMRAQPCFKSKIEDSLVVGRKRRELTSFNVYHCEHVWCFIIFVLQCIVLNQLQMQNVFQR